MSTSHAPARHSHNGKISTVTDEIDNLKETVITGVHDTQASGTRVLKAAGKAAVGTAGQIRDSAMAARDRAGETISSRPFTSVAIAAGVGAMLGAGFMMWRKR